LPQAPAPAQPQGNPSIHAAVVVHGALATVALATCTLLLGLARSRMRLVPERAKRLAEVEDAATREELVQREPAEDLGDDDEEEIEEL